MAVAGIAAPASAQVIVDTCETPGPVTYLELASKLAPVFWFSPDEPLLGPSRSVKKNPLPHRLPILLRGAGERPGPDRDGFVYFRVNKLRLRAEHDSDGARTKLRHPPGIAPTPVPLSLLSRLEFRFFSYYEEDIGFGNHAHDLEVVDVSVDVEVGRSATGLPCERLHIARVEGTAHGSDWYTNTLEIDRYVDDLVVPLHVLVEEGKHATAPDRNADGVYSPGYDVNRRASDAWGIRDTLRNKRQGGVSYHAEGLKSRSTMPVRSTLLGTDTPLYVAQYRGQFLPTNRSLGRSVAEVGAMAAASQGDTGHYRLYEGGVGGTAGYCTGDGRVSPRLNGEGTKNLFEMMTRWRFCALSTADGQRREVEFLRSTGPQGPGGGTFGDRVSLSWTNHAGVEGGLLSGFTSSLLFGLRAPLIDGWLVPQIGALRQPGSVWARTPFDSRTRLFGDVVFFPSASHAADFYVAVGGQLDRRDTQTERTLVQEVGLKFRVPKRLRFTMNSMVSARLGYRGSLHRGLEQGHWALQLGIGGW